jgi:hypothetical protein
MFGNRGNITMSRIGKQPVPIPEKVKVDVKADNTVFVEGPKGKVNKTFSPVVKISIADKKVTFAPTEETRFSRAMYGTARSVVAGMVKGVTEGYTKELEIQGRRIQSEPERQADRFSLGLFPSDCLRHSRRHQGHDHRSDESSRSKGSTSNSLAP